MNWVRCASLRSTWSLNLGFFGNQAFHVAHGSNMSYISAVPWFDRGEREGPSVYRWAHFSPMRVLLLPQVYRLRPGALRAGRADEKLQRALLWDRLPPQRRVWASLSIGR